jgi:AcrR family transcriptional regulator
MMMSPPSVRQREKTEMTRSNLLQAAIRVFSLRGYAEATIEAITKEAGYSKGAFYRHWPTKEDAFFTLITEGMSYQQEKMQTAWSQAGSLSEMITMGYSAFAEDTSGYWTPLFSEMWAQAARNEKIRQRMVEVYQKWFDLLTLTVHQLQADGIMTTNISAEKMAAINIALLDGHNVQRILGFNMIDAKDIGSIVSRLYGI